MHNRDSATPIVGILGAGPNQMPLIHEALRSGIRLVTIDGSRDRIGHMFSSSDFIIANLAEPWTVHAACVAENVRSVATIGSDLAWVAAEYCRRRLEPGVETPFGGRLSKIDQLHFLRSARISVPLSRVVRQDSESDGHLNDEFCDVETVVVKPASKWGTLGVSVVRRAESGRLDGLRSALDRAMSLDGTRLALVQEYISGTEYGVSATISNGDVREFGVTRKLKIKGGWRSFGHFPIFAVRRDGVAMGEFEYRHAVWRLLSEIARGPGAADRSFSVDVDLVVRDESLYVLEFACRGGGSAVGHVLDNFFCTRFVRSELERAVGLSGMQVELVDGDCGSREVDFERYRPVALAARQDILAKSLAEYRGFLTIGPLFLATMGRRDDTSGFGNVDNSIAIFRIPIDMSYDEFCTDHLKLFL